MAQHLCIVAHDSPLLLGYLNIVLQHLTADGNELQIIIDRRPDLPLRKEPAPPPQAMVSDQRRVRGVDELLRTQGYAIVSRRDGMSWQLSEGGQLPAEELDAADELEEEDATRAPGRRRTLVSALVFAAAVVSVAMVLPRDTIHRLADGVAGVADRGTSWFSASVDEPRTAPGREPPAAGSATDETRPIPAPVETKVPTPPDAAAALRSVPPTARPEMAPPRSAELPRPAEPPRAVEPAPAVEPPSRAVASARAVDRPRSTKATRAATPPPAVERAAAPAPRTELPPKQSAARAVSAIPAREEAIPAERPSEVAGLPRFEMTRERDAAGRTAVITVRVTDTAGRPLPTADVRIRRQLGDGGIRETQLVATTPGSYRGALPNAGPNTNGLTMRILLGDLRYEVPLAE